MGRVITLLVLLTASVSSALPAEGFENFAIINQGKTQNYFSTNFDYQAPVWRNDFESVELMGGTPIGNNLLSVGAKTMIGPQTGERSAYFARFDWILFDTQSIALKYIHEDWSYIASSKEVWSADYNLFAPFGTNSGFYMSLGYYYRWLKQRWNEPWASPLNYDTRDQESFLQGVFGLKVPIFSDANFMTFDINWRDNFSYYNADNFALDTGFYFPGESFLLRINLGMRTAAVTMGAAAPSEYYGSIGFLW